jgi:DNA-binding response OmpR family regulator
MRWFETADLIAAKALDSVRRPMREFPPFRLDTVNQCLWRGDGAAEERVLVAPKAFDVLRYLVEHPGRLVPHVERAAQARSGCRNLTLSARSGGRP